MGQLDQVVAMPITGRLSKTLVANPAAHPGPVGHPGPAGRAEPLPAAEVAGVRCHKAISNIGLARQEGGPDRRGGGRRGTHHARSG